MTHFYPLLIHLIILTNLMTPWVCPCDAFLKLVDVALGQPGLQLLRMCTRNKKQATAGGQQQRSHVEFLHPEVAGCWEAPRSSPATITYTICGRLCLHKACGLSLLTFAHSNSDISEFDCSMPTFRWECSCSVSGVAAAGYTPVISVPPPQSSWCSKNKSAGLALTRCVHGCGESFKGKERQLKKAVKREDSEDQS